MGYAYEPAQGEWMRAVVFPDGADQGCTLVQRTARYGGLLNVREVVKRFCTWVLEGLRREGSVDLAMQTVWGGKRFTSPNPETETEGPACACCARAMGGIPKEMEEILDAES